MQTDSPALIPLPDPVAAEGRRESLERQVRFAEQRILQFEQQALEVERGLPELDRKVEESRQTPEHDTILKAREAKALERVAILESIAAAKKEIEVFKAQLAFVG